MQTTKRSYGITWKSLLIVAVLVVVITGVTIKDALKSARESANQRQCLSNLRELWSASMMYAEDYDGWMPVYTNDDPRVVNPLRGFPSPEKLHSSLSRYVKDQSAWFCPSALSADIDKRAATIIDCRYSNYNFIFCKPGILRTDGLHNVSPELMRLAGKPNLCPLIKDLNIISIGEKRGGPHPDGAINLIYLDGHVKSYKRD